MESALAVLLPAYVPTSSPVPSWMPSLHHQPRIRIPPSMSLGRSLPLSNAVQPSGWLRAAAPEASVAAAESDSSAEAARRLYIGNIPRTVDNAELASIVAEHGAVEKAEVDYIAHGISSCAHCYYPAVVML
ncbi:hypothetical protein MLD38_019632 [Melastoma candidum]|uniref:Uncharacterized protein n=1 Tax=Melastoma candidum TaxID=119954 RepID=A0ACB9QY70_9MYRT|nr:hypothetical protein MLD38_019632 [Melastoma candidum]